MKLSWQDNHVLNFSKPLKKLSDDVTVFFLFTFVWIQISVQNLSIMSEIADDSEKFKSQDDDKWKGIASSEKTREKYSKFIEITEKFLEPQKSAKKRKSDEQKDMQDAILMVEKFRFRCKLCNKSCLGTTGTTSTIRSHLKVSCYCTRSKQIFTGNF